MEDYVLYRRSPIMVTTIPKGTLLFRMVVHPEDDVKGVLLNSGKRCITPNYNVYFHPNPFIGSFALKEFIGEYGKTISVYILKHDVKVLKLIKPSKHTRRDKNNNTFIKRCSTVKKGCLPKKGREWDPCMSPALIKNYPDVVGMLAISIGDNAAYKRALKSKLVTQKVKTYINPVTDAREVTGIPELILHPLKTRPQTDIISDDSVVHDTNYELITKFNRQDTEKILSFMKRHATYDPETHFYTYKQ